MSLVNQNYSATIAKSSRAVGRSVRVWKINRKRQRGELNAFFAQSLGCFMISATSNATLLLVAVMHGARFVSKLFAHIFSVFTNVIGEAKHRFAQFRVIDFTVSLRGRFDGFYFV